MGIHKLLSYLKSTDDLCFPQYESKQNIYISNVIYFDMTYKLIEAYNQFMKTEEMNHYGRPTNEPDDIRLSRLYSYIANELNAFFSKLINYNRAIYVFIDYRVPDQFIMPNLLFKDFISDSIDPRERLNAIPMMLRSDAEMLETCDAEMFNSFAASMRCMFELTDRNGKLNGYDVTEYVSVPYLLNRRNSGQVHDRLEYLNSLGRFRYIVLRGAKYSTRKRRGDRMFGFFDKDEWVENNVNSTLLNVLCKNDINKLKRYNEYIPFSLVLYALPIIVSMIETKGIYYMGSEIESDFALSKHVHAYSKYSFPTIYTTDSDLLVLLSDVDCVIKMNYPGNKKPYLINPVKFWNGVFGCDLPNKIIKILCVLLGTDYNPYHDNSPVHIRTFKDVLKWLNVKTYSEIDEDLLLVQLYMRMKQNPSNKYVQQTALALNMYLNDMEANFHFINNIDSDTVDAEKFLSIFRNSWFPARDQKQKPNNETLTQLTALTNE